MLVKARVGFGWKITGGFVEGEFASGFSECVPVLAVGLCILAAGALNHS